MDPAFEISRELQQARDDIVQSERGTREADHGPTGDDSKLRKLLGIVEQLNSELDANRVLRLAGRRIIEVFDAGRVCIVDLHPDGKRDYRLAVTFLGRPIEHPDFEISHAVLSRVRETKEPVLIKDASGDQRLAERSSIRNLKLHSIMAVPLTAKGDLLGVVYADNHLMTGAFDEDSLRLLALFANHLGIALRNAELVEKLTRARDELALSERLKGIGQIATFYLHEIKNSLLPMRLIADSMEEDWDDNAFREAATQALPAAVKRLEGLTREILDYARPTVLNRTVVRLSAVLDEVLDELGPEIHEAGVVVKRNWMSGEPTTHADPARLREVFVNLVRNSVEAMADSEEKTLALAVQQAAPDSIQATVADSGSGISPQDIESVFEPFHTSKPKGTGLGLTYCQKIVQEHGGKIEALRDVSKGALFAVALPISGR